MPLAIGQTQIIDGSCWFYNGGLASPSYYQTKLEVTLNSQDIVNNTSNITLRLWARSVNPSYISSGNSQTPTIQGISLGAMWFDCSVTNVWYDFGTRTIDVPHNADGTLVLPCTASFVTTKTSSYSLRTGSVSGNVELTTIPRATLINSFNDFQIENIAGAIAGNAQVYSNAFYHRFKLLQGSTERASWDIGVQAVGVYAYALTLTNAQRDAIFGAMPTIDNQQFTLQLITYSDAARSIQVGSTQTKTAAGTIPVSYKPAITTANSNYSWTNKNSKLPLYLIQNVSTLTLLLSGGTVPTGATLAEYKVRFGTITRQAAYSGAAISENVGLITASGTLYAYYSIKDSRGRWSAEISETLIGNALGVQAYNPPINNGFDVGRNAATPTSADYILKFANSLYSIGNTWTYTLQYWNGSSWATAKVATAIAAASIDSVYTHALPYSESLVYNVKAVLTDQFNTVEYTDTLSTSEFPISFGKKGCGFGKDTSDTYNIEAGLLGISSEGPIVGRSGNEIVNLDGNLGIQDTREVATSTDLGLRGVRFDFKQNTVNGVFDGGSFNTVMTVQQWDDSSGGKTHQLAFSDGGNMWHRIGDIGGSWGAWNRIIQETRNAKKTIEIGLGIPPNNTNWELMFLIYVPVYTSFKIKLIVAGVQQGVASFGCDKEWTVSRDGAGITVVQVKNGWWGTIDQTSHVASGKGDGYVAIYGKSANTFGCSYAGEAEIIGAFTS